MTPKYSLKESATSLFLIKKVMGLLDKIAIIT